MSEIPVHDIGGLGRVPLSVSPLKRKDFTSDQEVRWCPGCGDYAILSAVQGLLPTLGIARENTVVISGIGCSSRFPYYVNSYGMHSIHGRALTIATGLAITRPDLAIMVATGDGDALSIGGNHLVHTLRRNVNLTVVLFNNRIYGLTKGQFSPTSEQGKVTKSSPAGSLDTPVNAVSLALGAEASFVARSIDSDRAHLTSVLRAAFEHRGSSLVEIYQNCPIFNDGAWDELTGPDSEGVIKLEAGEPVLSPSGNFGVVQGATGHLELASVADVGLDKVIVHDPGEADPTRAFALSRLTDSGVMRRSPIGIFRDVDRPSFDDLSRQQIATAQGGATADVHGKMTQLQTLLAGDDIWTVG
ncbi:2-oxoacid:ferredoxin oxidoreductase subunit beta [Brooklawnia sp.]|uniref:2-oxoacid:ferredoxin oxidoreductase subunit beta n=1 Tax=Brooklawnia sp. TaxID=2699740 RepID=UPI00311F3C6B